MYNFERKKLIYLIALVMGFMAISTQAKLVHHWTLDENTAGGDTVAVDSVGGVNGTILGATTVEGVYGNALKVGANATVQVDNFSTADIKSITLAFWINPSAGHTLTGGYKRIISANHGWEAILQQNSGVLGNNLYRAGGTYAMSTVPPTEEEWTHVAMTADFAGSGLQEIYMNGVLDNSMEGQAVDDWDGGTIGFGYRASGGTVNFEGMLDDIQIHNVVLTAEQILEAMEGGPKLTATAPQPADGDEDVDLATTLHWESGEYADTHDVYFGTNFDDVNDATVNSDLYQGRLSDTVFTPESLLTLGETYYWRVDEVNAVPTTIFKGNIWSFEAEPVSFALAGDKVSVSSLSMNLDQDPNRTIDGSGLDEEGNHNTDDVATMWLSAPKGDENEWLQYDFDQVYKLDKIHVWNHNSTSEWLLGYSGKKTVLVEATVDGSTWTEVGTVEFPKAPGLDYAGDDVPLSADALSVRMTILEGWTTLPGVVTQVGLSEVQFYTVPMKARLEEPASGTTNLDPKTTLSWRSGREADQHEVLLGTDPNALILVDTVDVPSYEANLELGQTYYWQINEINEAGSIPSWPSEVWTLSTRAYNSVDEMEEYEVGNEIWNAWIDGYGNNSNGAVIGNGYYGTPETEIVYAGKQSMPFEYGAGSATNSETTQTWAQPLPLKQDGVLAMSLMFYGTPSNTAGSMYIKINGIKVSTYPTDSHLTEGTWLAWTFDLADGMDTLSSMTIGVDGGAGKFYVDAIRLYPMASELITAVMPDNAELLASYDFEGNYNDGSGNGLNGTPVANAVIVSDPRGSVLNLDGDSCVDLGDDSRFNFPGNFSLTAWVNISDFNQSWGHNIFANRGENNMGWQVRRHGGTNGLSFTVRGTTGNDNGPVGATDMSALFFEWTQVTAVYDVDTGRKLYVNGVLDLSVTETGAVNPAQHNVLIGARATQDNSSQERFFLGMIDDVMFYNRALSTGEAMGLAGRTDSVFKPF